MSSMSKEGTRTARAVGVAGAGAVHFSDSEDEDGSSSDDAETWITAATRERFGYCAWRVKRCLMKQVRARGALYVWQRV